MSRGPSRCFSPNRPQYVRLALVVPLPQTKTNLLGNQILHWAEALNKFSKQSCSCGSDQLVWFVALRDGNPPSSEYRQRCRCRNWETPVSAIDPSGAFGGVSG